MTAPAVVESKAPVESKGPCAEVQVTVMRAQMRAIDRDLSVMSKPIEKEYQACVQAKEKMERSESDLKVHIARGAHKVSRRYRRRDKQETERLDVLATARADADRELAIAEENKRLAAEFESEKKDLTDVLESDQKGYEKAVAMMTAKLKSLGIVTPNFVETFEAKRRECEEKKKAIQEQIDKIESEETAKWLLENKAIMEDRAMSLLFADIMKSEHWMTDPHEGKSSGKLIGTLEKLQQDIADGKVPPTHEYAGLKTAFMYSASRCCVVMLERKKDASPVRWEHKYYYQPAPIAEARKIFSACDGTPIKELHDSAVSHASFADV